MANAAEAPAPVAAAASSGMSKKTVLLIGAALAILAVGGAVAFFLLRGGPDAAPPADHADTSAAPASGQAGAAAGAKGEAGTLYDLDSFIVNLADAPEVRYLKLTVKLELERPEASAEVAARVPQIRDAVLILLSSKDSTSLRSTQGKFQLRDEITQRINAAIPKGGVKTVYFTEFVIQ